MRARVHANVERGGVRGSEQEWGRAKRPQESEGNSKSERMMGGCGVGRRAIVWAVVGYVVRLMLNAGV